MHMIQLFKRLNGKTEVVNLAQAERVSVTQQLRVAQLEDELNFYKQAMMDVAKIYLIAKAKLN